MREILDLLIQILEIIVFILKLAAISIIIMYVIYVVLLNKLVKLIAEENRLIEPSQVWLLFVPVFSLVFQFYFYKQLIGSLKREFNSRDVKNDLKTDAKLFYASSFLNIVTTVGFVYLCFNPSFTPTFIAIFSISSPVFFIKFVKIFSYVGKELKEKSVD